MQMSRTRRVEFAISDSVWLSMSGRQFRKALSKEEEQNALQESIPKSTRYATKWAVKIFGEWQSGRDNKDPGKEQCSFKFYLGNVEALDTNI